MEEKKNEEQRRFVEDFVGQLQPMGEKEKEMLKILIKLASQVDGLQYLGGQDGGGQMVRFIIDLARRAVERKPLDGKDEENKRILTLMEQAIRSDEQRLMEKQFECRKLKRKEMEKRKVEKELCAISWAQFIKLNPDDMRTVQRIVEELEEAELRVQPGPPAIEQVADERMEQDEELHLAAEIQPSFQELSESTLDKSEALPMKEKNPQNVDNKTSHNKVMENPIVKAGNSADISSNFPKRTVSLPVFPSFDIRQKVDRGLNKSSESIRRKSSDNLTFSKSDKSAPTLLKNREPPLIPQGPSPRVQELLQLNETRKEIMETMKKGLEAAMKAATEAALKEIAKIGEENPVDSVAKSSSETPNPPELSQDSTNNSYARRLYQSQTLVGAEKEIAAIRKFLDKEPTIEPIKRMRLGSNDNSGTPSSGQEIDSQKLPQFEFAPPVSIMVEEEVMDLVPQSPEKSPEPAATNLSTTSDGPTAPKSAESSSNELSGCGTVEKILAVDVSPPEQNSKTGDSCEPGVASTPLLIIRNELQESEESPNGCHEVQSVPQSDSTANQAETTNTASGSTSEMEVVRIDTPEQDISLNADNSPEYGPGPVVQEVWSPHPNSMFSPNRVLPWFSRQRSSSRASRERSLTQASPSSDSQAERIRTPAELLASRRLPEACSTRKRSQAASSSDKTVLHGPNPARAASMAPPSQIPRKLARKHPNEDHN